MALEKEFITSGDDPEDNYLQEQRIARLKAELKGALSTLNRREREIVVKRRGLNGWGLATLEDLRKEYGISRERVRQIQKKAEKKLKKILIEELI